MKTATNRLFGWFLLSFVGACEFGQPSIDADYLGTTTGGKGGYSPDGSVTLESCPTACSTVTLLSLRGRKLRPSARVMDLSNGDSCICPNGVAGSTSTSEIPAVAGSSSELPASGGSGQTQDPPTSGGSGITTDPPPASGGSGITTDPPPVSGGSGQTQDPPASGAPGITTDPPPASGGSGQTTDPPPAYGGSGQTQDPPGSGGVASGGASSLGKGGGSTQDPPAGGKPASGGSLGAGGATQGLALGGSPASGGSTPVGQGGGSTQDPPPAGGTSASGGSLGAGGSNTSGGTMSVGIGGGSTQDPPPAGGTSASGGSLGAGGTSAMGGSSPTGGTAGTGGTTSNEDCDPQEYKFWITDPKQNLGEGTIIIQNERTQQVISTSCGNNSTCCYYEIPNSCDAWLVYESTQATKMPRIPTFDTSTQSCKFIWGTIPRITTTYHIDLEEGVDYTFVLDGTQCYMRLVPHAGTWYYI